MLWLRRPWLTHIHLGGELIASLVLDPAISEQSSTGRPSHVRSPKVTKSGPGSDTVRCGDVCVRHTLSRLGPERHLTWVVRYPGVVRRREDGGGGPC